MTLECEIVLLPVYIYNMKNWNHRKTQRTNYNFYNLGAQIENWEFFPFLNVILLSIWGHHCLQCPSTPHRKLTVIPGLGSCTHAEKAHMQGRHTCREGTHAGKAHQPTHHCKLYYCTKQLRKTHYSIILNHTIIHCTDTQIINVSRSHTCTKAIDRLSMSLGHTHAPRQSTVATIIVISVNLIINIC